MCFSSVIHERVRGGRATQSNSVRMVRIPLERPLSIGVSISEAHLKRKPCGASRSQRAEALQKRQQRTSTLVSPHVVLSHRITPSPRRWAARVAVSALGPLLDYISSRLSSVFLSISSTYIVAVPECFHFHLPRSLPSRGVQTPSSSVECARATPWPLVLPSRPPTRSRPAAEK